MTETYKYDIGGLLSMHARTLNLVDLSDQAIQSIRDLLCRPMSHLSLIRAHGYGKE